MAEKNIFIIGAGYAGVHAAKKLAKNTNVTILFLLLL